MFPKYSATRPPHQPVAVAECDPLRMATIATLFGVDTADPADCDVLELGCGDGANLLSLAASYPGVRPVGYDPDVAAIARGEAWRDAAGLGHVRFVGAGAEGELDESADFVIANRVLSWVDAPTRATVVETAARAARPGGLVAFTYPAFPQGRFALIAREMVLSAFDVAADRAEAAGTTLTHADFARIAVERLRLAVQVAGAGSVHGAQMNIEANKLEAIDPAFLFEGDLAEVMQPFRVSDVAAMGAAQGLRYVGELAPQDLWQAWLPAELAATVRAECGLDAVRRQQLVDDVLGLGFHGSLFVRADAPVRPEPSLQGRTFHVHRIVEGIANADGQADAVSAPVAQVLREHDGRTVTVAEIAAELGRDEAVVGDAVLELYARGLALISTTPPPLPAAPGTAPRAVPLVLRQLKEETLNLTTRFHRPFGNPAPIYRALLSLLDGTRDRDAVLRDLPAAADSAGAAADAAAIATQLDQVLELLAQSGLLLPPDEA